MIRMAAESSFWGLRVGSRNKWNWICTVQYWGSERQRDFYSTCYVWMDDGGGIHYERKILCATLQVE